MDYGRLARRELQALCKEHGIPANKTNVFMADALNSLLNGPKQKEKEADPGPDPAEVVKARATRSRKAAIPAEQEIVSQTELENLSASLAQSTINDSFGSGSTTTDEDTHDEPGAKEEAPSKMSNTLNRRKAGEVRSKAKQDVDMVPPVAVFSPEIAPAIPDAEIQSTTDTSPELVDDIVDVLLPVPEAATKKSKLKSKGKKTSKAQITETGAPEMPSSFIDVAATENPIDLAVDTPLPSVDEANTNKPEEAAFPPSEESVVDPPDVSKKSAGSKKSKGKGSKSKKNRTAAAADIEPTFETAFVGGAEEQSRGPAAGIDSPTFGLTMESNCGDLVLEKLAAELKTQGSGISTGSSTVEEEAFEFQPVPESFNEIMSSEMPQDTAVPAPGCCHRAGRKNGMGGCLSCASERKVAELMQGMLESMDSMDMATAVAEKELVSLPLSAHSATTPTKPQDDKENVLKSENAEDIPLEKLSMRKLQKKLQNKKGLSKRNNMTAPSAVL